QLVGDDLHSIRFASATVTAQQQSGCGLTEQNRIGEMICPFARLTEKSFPAISGHDLSPLVLRVLASVPEIAFARPRPIVLGPLHPSRTSLRVCGRGRDSLIGLRGVADRSRDALARDG